MKRNTLLSAITLALCIVCGCQTSGSGSSYATPEQAADALANAARARDREQLAKIFGSAIKEIESGIAEQDDEDLQRFAAAYDRKHELRLGEDGAYTLLVGGNDWFFPVPIVANKDKWMFDTAAGIDEIRNRRIGRNEFAAIRSCRGYVRAQSEYWVLDPDNDGTPSFATRIISTEGTRDGLYWPANENELQSPLGPHMAEAFEQGDLKAELGRTQSYRGYYFRILKKQAAAAPGGAMSYIDDTGRMTKGIALIAWPAEYAETGVMSFQVSGDGKVFERDLGEDTATEVEKIDAYDPAGWTAVELPK